MVVLVDHDIFKSIPLDERVGKRVYDTRGIWPDQPRGEDIVRSRPRLVAT
jgi:UDP-N-acetyl-D-mannosaminuronic acid dehydrogenase